MGYITQYSVMEEIYYSGQCKGGDLLHSTVYRTVGYRANGTQERVIHEGLVEEEGTETPTRLEYITQYSDTGRRNPVLRENTFGRV
jgi:hypothetical protein